MVTLQITADGWPIVTQQDVPPTVYLDHWALRKFSEDTVLASRLTRVLQTTRGTLALSWLNLAEFSKVTDLGQGKKAEEFYASNFPQVFFLDSDPFSVIRREDALRSREPPVIVAPHADVGFLSTFARRHPGSPPSYTLRELFRPVQADQLGPMLDKLSDTVAERIQVLRGKHAQDAEFRSTVSRLPRGPQVQRGTRYILRELLRSFLADRTMRISRNHAIDFMHAVVPVAYCEFVLLDKHWEAQVRQARGRLVKSKLSVPLANVYSEGRNGIERFFQDLEACES